MNLEPDWLVFVGRMHPLLVHLPLGMLFYLGVTEALAFVPRYRNANASTPYVLALTVPLILATTVCGWVLAWSGGYDPGLLDLHRWFGVATAGLTLLAGLCFWRGWRSAYYASLGLSLVGLMGAGHWGGSLTHGSDYLGRYAPGPLRWLLGGARPAPASGAPVSTLASSTNHYQVVVQPLLDRYCVDCHGAEKQKGGLRLDTYEGTMAGAKDGPVVVANQPEASSMLRLMKLPLSDDDHMPPEGKPQPSPEEILQLEDWVRGGASP